MAVTINALALIIIAAIGCPFFLIYGYNSRRIAATIANMIMIITIFNIIFSSSLSVFPA